MAIIVNILKKGERIELINTDGKEVTFSDIPDGYHYEAMDICGTHMSGDLIGTKNARDVAIEFLEKKGHKELAQKLRPDYRPQRKHLYGYLPCPAVPLAASA